MDQGITLEPGTLTLDHLRTIHRGQASLLLADHARERMAASRRVVERIAAGSEPVYGINTGFGKLAQMRQAARTLAIEANGVTDNPLVLVDDSRDQMGEVISGGNFHAEPVAMAADQLAIAAAEIGALSERRIAMLIDPAISGLPAFLVAEPGLNSGFMLAHVTAASLASENKSLAHPASVDSLPTSANQEDHVSMATFAARRLGSIAANVEAIVGIELLAAAQGMEFQRPLRTSPPLEDALALIRAHVPAYDRDRYFAPDLASIGALVGNGGFDRFVPLDLRA